MAALTNSRFLALSLALVVLPALGTPAKSEGCRQYTYGLYYGTWPDQDGGLAFVISRDGKAIPPKANDPDAPTEPGFYVGEQRFRFASTRTVRDTLSFKTDSIDGVVFEFRGKFGCEAVDVIPDVPYWDGELTEFRNGKVARAEKVHFGHAVIL